MKKASEYRRHAEECRQLAAQMESGDHRDQLLDMAATWDSLAAERERLVEGGENASFGNPASEAQLGADDEQGSSGRG